MAARKKRGTKKVKETRGRKKGSTKLGTAEFNEYVFKTNATLIQLAESIVKLELQVDTLTKRRSLVQPSLVGSLSKVADAALEAHAEASTKDLKEKSAEPETDDHEQERQEQESVHQNGATEPEAALSL